MSCDRSGRQTKSICVVDSIVSEYKTSVFDGDESFQTLKDLCPFEKERTVLSTASLSLNTSTRIFRTIIVAF